MKLEKAKLLEDDESTNINDQTEDTGGDDKSQSDNSDEEGELSIVKAFASGDKDRARELIKQKATQTVVDTIRGL